MEPQTISLDVLAEKYAKGKERTAADIHARVARALAAVEANPAEREAEFLSTLQAGFVPAGRIMSAAGTDIRATLINCFVQPVGDSVSDDVDGKPGIYKALAQAAETMRRGGGVGYDFSRIRPSGSMVGSTHSHASGPLSFMQVFNASCETVESAGSRRGAQMGVLRIDHPDVEAFVHAKDKGDFKNFNLSVGVSDAFMQAVERDLAWELVHKARPGDAQIGAGAHQRQDGLWVYRSIPARTLWDQIMRSTYDHAEPGILFLDTANRENNLYYCETFEATNPCAEEFLPDYGCCCLGSLDLTRFVQQPFTAKARFDFGGFVAVARSAVRMLDDVLDVTYWPLPEQHAEARNKRRIGLGFLGLGDACIMLGLRYDGEPARHFAAEMGRYLRDAAYAASAELAQEKGAFPLFDAEKYLAGAFVKRLPESLREAIAKGGLRNSHLLAVAPTGTISLAFADNASNGIEPAFSWAYTRKKRMSDNTLREYEVADHAWRFWRDLGGDVSALPPAFVTALEMSAQDHMRMLSAVQPFIDTSISKTVNVPEDYPFGHFKDLYLEAWKAGLKGLATYRPNSVLGAVLQAAPAQAPSSLTPQPADTDPLTRRIEGRPAGDLQAVTAKVSYMTAEGRKTVYLSISFAEVEGLVEGTPVRIERPIEFFMPAGQRDEGQQWIASNMRLLSLVARSGGSVAKSLQNMREVVWDKGPVRCGEVIKADGSRVPRFHQSEVAAIAYALQEMLRRRGFLREDGREQPIAVLAQRSPAPEGLRIDLEHPGPAPDLLASGRICPDCGGPFLRRVDGCDRCDNCGYIGSCG
ncbi:MAG: adenosylcobalamin-dependent ribonucleoside-diphosphate reductase [Betaproteobacteria bacterium]|nr:adenosylcobalamin-dependent ribonucleoside-diphosphate reductase [Betaproteobacteria bacterium]